MNDIITNGTEIKQRIIAEINNARQCIYLAMAWFTDRDIAIAIIEAKKRNVTVDIILSSNASNETVKLMLRGAKINVHAFDAGDERGMMHHKFCLIDNKISINGSYNYSYNASNNNVENIQVSDDSATYNQLFSEFERIKYNIDNNIDVNITIQMLNNNNQQGQPKNIVDSFSQQVHNLVYSSAQINTEEYKTQGREKSKESEGNIEIFKAECSSIKEEIRFHATDDSLSSKKSVLTSNVTSAFESKKREIEEKKQNEIAVAKRGNELEKRQIEDKLSNIEQEKSILESGNQSTGERGLLQIRKEMEENRLGKKAIEQSFVVRKFWSAGTILALLGLCIFVYYLSMFFASAMYKVFFEGNVIRSSLKAGINPGLPQLVDANAILKIFKQQGALFGMMALLFFLIPVLLSNLKLLGSDKKWVNKLCFWIGVLIFDVLVSTMVAINTDEIKSLLVGKESQLQIWEVVKHGEFWLIFIFGMLPLIITHFLINYVTIVYRKSQIEIIDAEKSRQIQLLDEEMIRLNSESEYIVKRIQEKDNAIKENSDKVLNLEKEINNQQNQIENRFAELLEQMQAIVDGVKAKITSGKIFTDEILDSVVAAYKSGFIEFLPNYYAKIEVAKRVREIEQFITNN